MRDDGSGRETTRTCNSVLARVSRVSAGYEQRLNRFFKSGGTGSIPAEGSGRQPLRMGLSHESAGSNGPLLHVWPVPNHRGSELRDRFREIGVATSPYTDDLTVRHAESVSDLGGSHQWIHVYATTHDRDHKHHPIHSICSRTKAHTCRRHALCSESVADLGLMPTAIQLGSTSEGCAYCLPVQVVASAVRETRFSTLPGLTRRHQQERFGPRSLHCRSRRDRP